MIDGPASGVKLCKLPSGDFAFAVAAPSTADGKLHNPEAAAKPKTSGRLYTGIFVRHWDKWIGPNKRSIWYGVLSKGDNGQFKLSQLHNALANSELECPVPPFGGAEDFDIGLNGIIFVAKDPDLNPALNTKMNVYILPINDFVSAQVADIIMLPVHEIHGAASSPVFSPDGKHAAFLKMKTNGYEADKNQVFLVRDISSATVTQIYATPDGKGRWDRSPSKLLFSEDGQTLYLLAENQGRSSLWTVGIKGLTERDAPLPLRISALGSISGKKTTLV
jgi:hypothetical protein